MKIYDIIIIGGGPAGLKCAETLGQTDKTVLLLEKKPIFGDKLCAGGLTKKDIEVLPLPDEVIEHKISRTALHSRRQSTGSNSQTPFLFTVNRNGQLIIISTDAPNEKTETVIKKKLNYKKVDFKANKPGEMFLLPLKIKNS